MADADFSFSPLPTSVGQFISLVVSEWILARLESNNPAKRPGKAVAELAAGFQEQLDDDVRGIAIILGTVCKHNEVEDEDVERLAHVILFLSEVSTSLRLIADDISGDNPGDHNG